jgi:acylphosphatase
MAKRMVISGGVQGVGFRFAMVAEAARLGVTGWVRNRRDGTVEAVVDGDAASVAALIQWARHGPPGARVASLSVDETDGTFVGFDSRPTA